MASGMDLIAKTCFFKAQRITDRFHVQKLAFEAVQEIHIKHRWEAIDIQNQQFSETKIKKKTYFPIILENGDTHRQLLARSRYLLFKLPHKWSETQRARAVILFREYPDIQKAYRLSRNLSNIFNLNISKAVVLTKMAHWFKDAENSGFKSFQSIQRSFEQHYSTILNYFNNTATNAYAESFNARIKDFRRNFRGVRDSSFFIFRLNKIFG